jgi:hypothetical protein
VIILDVDPNIVRPGLTPLFITLLLAAAMVFLYLSMRKQFRKIRIPDDASTEASADDSDDASESNDSAAPTEESASERPPGTSG